MNSTRKVSPKKMSAKKVTAKKSVRKTSSASSTFVMPTTPKGKIALAKKILTGVVAGTAVAGTAYAARKRYGPGSTSTVKTDWEKMFAKKPVSTPVSATTTPVQGPMNVPYYKKLFYNTKSRF